ncbi:MAG: hypothetical protein SF051_03875 [Elusimicrobiota bacterium]|nr:hypothetical protein [Elusimicrobiota bacterium]
MRRALLLVLLAAGACVRLDFGRRVSDDELRLRRELEGYYLDAAAAFAAASPEALAALYDPAITRPMTREKIREWGVEFFGKHGPARFKVEKLEFDRLGYQDAVVTLTYRVETRDGEGSFGGVEQDEFVKKGGRWLMTGWEKVPARSK